jgi:hypothetical protein
VARKQAETLLAKHAVLLGTGDSSWVVGIADHNPPLHTLVYEQFWNGLRVVGGRADVRVHECGGVSFFGAIAFPIPANLVVTPVVQSQQAVVLAYASQGLDTPLGPVMPALARTRLVLWGDQAAIVVTPARLAWEVSIDELDRDKVGRAYIDAITGNLLEYANDLHYCVHGHTHVLGDHPAASAAAAAQPRFVVSYGAPSALTNVTGNIKGWLNATVDGNGAVSNNPLAGIKVSFGGNTAYTNKYGDFEIVNAGTAAGTLSASWPGGKHWSTFTALQGTAWTFSTTATPGTPVNIQVYTSALTILEEAQTTALYCVNKVNEWMRTIIPSPDNRISTNLPIRVNSTATCNATTSTSTTNWSSPTATATLTFYNAGGNPPCPNTAFSTVVEHEWGHALDYFYGGIYQGSYEGLSEGWGDIMALYSTGQPMLGQNFNASYPNGLRNGTNTKTYRSCSEVHCAGESWMGWAWDVRVAMIAKLGSAAGIARAENIVIGSIVANATTQPTAVTQVFLRDDNDASLNNGTPNCDVLGAACTKRIITNPTTNCAGPIAAAFTPYGVPCPGSAGIPVIGVGSQPILNTSLTITLTSALANTATLLNLGASNTIWNGIPLPFDLGVAGMPECWLNAGADVIAGSATDAAGTASLAFAIPNDASLVGAFVYCQWQVLDPTVNSTGVVHSRGGQIRFGTQ